ncbi:tetratricopeptide repeat protein [bacterium]|nr:tetratricopeptide repeat protein [bacterium]
MKHWMAWIAILLGILIVAGCAQLPDDKLIAKGKTLEEEGKFEEALKFYRKVPKNHPNSPLCAEAQYHIALVEANGLQKFEEAVNTFGTLIGKYPDTKFAPQAQFMIGFIYANNVADTTQARKAYQEFLNKYPDHELAASVEWELKYLGKDINEIPELMNLEPATSEVVQK